VTYADKANRHQMDLGKIFMDNPILPRPAGQRTLFGRSSVIKAGYGERM
jgi:hypothetical protein